jgi:hypothetical protein
VHNDFPAFGGVGGYVLISGNYVYDNVGNDGPANQIREDGGGGIHVSTYTDGTRTEISDNIVEYNYSPYWGGGIYASSTYVTAASTLVLDGNVVRHNVAATGGGIFTYAANTGSGSYVPAEMTDNRVYGNVAYGATEYENYRYLHGGGGSLARHALRATDNIIVGNQALLSEPVYGLSGGGGLRLAQGHDFYGEVSDNVLADNYSTGLAGGLALQGTWVGSSDSSLTLKGNRIVNNVAGKGYGGVWLVAGVGKLRASLMDNLVSGNVSQANTGTLEDTAVCVVCGADDTAVDYGDEIYVINGNYLAGNEGRYTLTYNRAQGSPDLDAKGNWWGTADQTQIGDQIYDFFDDSDYAVVNFSDYLDAAHPILPLSPPRNLKVTPNGDGFDLTWDANPEGGITGYSIFYDDEPGYPYEGTGANQGNSAINVGNVTSYRVTGLPAGRYHYFAITARSGGRESWLSQEERGALGEVSFRNGDFELGASGDWLESPGNKIVMGNGIGGGIKPASGDHAAVVGYANRVESELSQRVNVDGAKSKLRFQYMLWGLHTAIHCEYGEITVRIDGQAVDEDFDTCDDTTAAGWQTREVDLGSYAGQTVTLSFYTNVQNSSSLVIDDVQLGQGSPQVNLTSNYGDGAPGSFFAITGRNFPAGSDARVSVNGRKLDTLTADASGSLSFILRTGAGLPAGSYEVEVSVNPSASTTITIDPQAPVRAQEGTGPIVEVPDDIGAKHKIYLPIMLR